MKLVQIKNENLRKGERYISVSDSMIAFSKQAVTELGLTSGIKLKFLQDAEKPKDWYLQVATDGDIELRNFKSAEHLCFSSTSMCKKIRESLKLTGKKAVRIKLGVPFDHEGMQLIAFLTAGV